MLFGVSLFMYVPLILAVVFFLIVISLIVVGMIRNRHKTSLSIFEKGLLIVAAVAVIIFLIGYSTAQGVARDHAIGDAEFVISINDRDIYRDNDQIFYVDIVNHEYQRVDATYVINEAEQILKLEEIKQ